MRESTLTLLVFGAGLLGLLHQRSFAHEVRPGYLEINETFPGTYDVLWKVPRTADMQLNISPVLPESFKRAALTQRIVSDAVISHWTATSSVPLARQTIRIDGLERTFTDVLVRAVWLDGRKLTTRLTPSAPSFVVPAVPSVWQVAWTYLIIGIEHIIFGLDHLLFVLALLLIVDGHWKLLKTITAFTFAHSITLAIATFGWLDIPGPPVEAVIALSIVFVAAEILRKVDGQDSLTERQPWIVAFTFGLLHGFGFAGALSEVGLPAGDIPMALLTFNIGVELGQLAFVAVVLLAWQLLRDIPIKWPGWTIKVLPYSIGTVAAFWTLQRISGFF